MTTETTALDLPAELKDLSPFHHWASFPVRTQADVELAVAAMTEIKIREKLIEKKREELFGPLKRAIRDFESKVRDYLQPLGTIRETLNNRIVTFWKAKEDDLRREKEAQFKENLSKEQVAAKAAMELAAMTGDEKAIEEAMQRKGNVEKMVERGPGDVSQTVRTSGSTLAQVKKWTWKIVDEKLIPREYLIVDEKKLNQLARETEKNGVLIVPGVEFYQELRTSLRA